MYYTTKLRFRTEFGTFCFPRLRIINVQLYGREALMELNKAISQRLKELLTERKMTQYQLYIRSGVPRSTIGNVVNCAYTSVNIRVIHEMCQGLDVSLTDFFNSPLFLESNLEP